jgi:membrane protease subunit HflK
LNSTCNTRSTTRPSSSIRGTRDPDETLKQAAESAVREVIGSNNLDAIMPDQRVEPVAGEAAVANPSAELALQAKKVVQGTLERYDAGLLVTELNFQNVRPPEQVKDAFDDAIKAREDEQRAINDARCLRQATWCPRPTAARRACWPRPTATRNPW